MRVFGPNNIGEGGDVQEVEWSTSEQVWPLEKGPTGQTLYFKYVNFGQLPNSGWKHVDHNITESFTLWKSTVIDRNIRINLPSTCDQCRLYQIAFIIYPTTVSIVTGSNRTGTDVNVKLIYYYN